MQTNQRHVTNKFYVVFCNPLSLAKNHQPQLESLRYHPLLKLSPLVLHIQVSRSLENESTVFIVLGITNLEQPSSLPLFFRHVPVTIFDTLLPNARVQSHHLGIAFSNPRLMNKRHFQVCKGLAKAADFFKIYLVNLHSNTLENTVL